MRTVRATLAACSALLLISCQALRDETNLTGVGVGGVKPTLEQMNIPNYTAVQDALVNDLVHKAGLDQMPGPGSSQWQYVTEAGLYEIGRQCDQYIDVLFRFNRNQRAIRQGLTQTGAATSAILGLASVAAMPIAITATAFGLAASLYDSGVNSVLYSVEPSALRNIVLRGRQGYLDRLELGTVNSRPRMLIALQGYLIQCSPAAIEANVNNAASGAESVVSIRLGATSAPAVFGAPGSTILQRPAATVLERSAQIIPQQVMPTPQQPVEDLALNRRLPLEVGITRRMLIAAQRSLGVVPADGDFGASDDSDTRTAIREFKLGANRRIKSHWPDADNKGVWTNRFNVVRLLTPIDNAIFKTPFERAFFGDPVEGDPSKRYSQLDAEEVMGMLSALKVPKNTWPPVGSANFAADAMNMLRVRFAELRQARSIDSKRGGELDSKLYDSLLDTPP